MMTIYCDGGSRGNPGPSASAFVVVDDSKKIEYSESKYLGINTNNVAEYAAVLMAVEWLIKLPVVNENSSVVVNLDSQLVERQLNGFYKVKNKNLVKIFNDIKTLIKKYNLKIVFQWGYREKNVLADSLVNKELDVNTSR
ncbi:MAG: ribonuclease HI family protein [bacterium]|nr:MAG: ribonuclease HI family protein [bacterium]